MQHINTLPSPPARPADGHKGTFGRVLIIGGSRGMSGAPTHLKYGSLSFDQVGRVAELSGERLELSARELGLLELFLRRPGRLVHKDQLVDHLCEWGEEISTNAIEVYVHRLRKKLSGGGIKISTVRSVGYCLEAAPEQ